MILKIFMELLSTPEKLKEFLTYLRHQSVVMFRVIYNYTEKESHKPLIDAINALKKEKHFYKCKVYKYENIAI